MSGKYVYSQHEHVERRKERGPATTKKTHLAANAKLVQAFNNKLGLGITQRVGTMWAAYVFFGLTLISLPSAIASQNVLVIVSWVAQTFLQLVLLPIIIVGQNIQAAAADARAIATYEDAGAILDESKQIQLHLEAQDAALDRLIQEMLDLKAKSLAGAGAAKTRTAAAAGKATAAKAAPLSVKTKAPR